MTKITAPPLDIDTAGWVAIVAPYVAAHIKAGIPEAEAIERGIADYRDLLEEMVAGKTERARFAINAIQATAFAAAHLRAATDGY